MTRPVVVKVGGSLLDWPGLPDRLSAYLESRRDDRLVLVVGGGRFADVLRDLDRIHGMGQERSHALAVRCMGLSARLLAALVPGSVVVSDPATLDAARPVGAVPILDPRTFLEADDRSESPLPHDWDVTSDSIAARVAERLDARELVLLKSTSPPPGVDWSEASGLGLVDPFFPEAARGLDRVAFLNLRDSSP